MQHPLRHWGYLLTLSALWGSSFLLISIALHNYGPGQIVFGRLTLGAMVLIVALIWWRTGLPRDWRSWRNFVLLALTGNIAPFFLIAWGQQVVASSTAGTLMAFMPLATLVLAHFFVPGERLNRYRMGGVVLGLGGVALLLQPELTHHPEELAGLMAILSAAMFYATNAVLAKRLGSQKPSVNAAGTLIAASLLAIPLLASAPLPEFQGLDPGPAGALIWLGAGATGLATLVFFRLITEAGPTFVSNINYLIPVVAFLLGVGLLGEAFDASALLALVLILAGVALSRRPAR